MKIVVKLFLNKRNLLKIIYLEKIWLFIKDTHSKETTRFLRMLVHCIKGTNEAELVL